MNRYPLWKYIVIVVALVIGLVYTLPNFYGESPAVQVSSGKATVKVTEQTLKTVEDLLRNADLHPNGIFFEQGAQQNTVRVRFEPTEAEKQLQAREVLEKALNPNREDPAYVVALNLTPNTPQWHSDCYKVLELMDAYDRIVSDGANEAEQMRHAYLVTEGAIELVGDEAKDFAERLKDTGIIQTPAGTSARSSMNTAPFARKSSQTNLLCTTSWRT